MKTARILAGCCTFALCLFLSLFLWERHLESHTVTVIRADGVSVFTDRCGETVAGLLEDYGIKIRTHDFVSPPLQAPAPPGGAITVTRIDQAVEKKTEVLPPRLIKKTTLKGNLRTVELRKIEQKKSYATIKTVYHNGEIHSRDVVQEHVFAKTSFFLNLLDHKGQQEKEYDLSKCRRVKMTATAYYPGDPLAWKDGKVTYLGLRMQRGIVAVDPRVIPLRTRVFVPGYGYGYAGDTGSEIKGRRIDLGVNNQAEETSWVYEPVLVYILEKNRSW